MKFSEMAPTLDLTRELWFPVLAPDADGDGFQENLRLSSNAFFELFGGGGEGGSNIHFISINVVQGEVVEELANYNNDGAQGDDSIAIGKNTEVLGGNTIVLGNNVHNETPDNIGIGHNQEFNGINLVQIGHGAVANGNVGVVVGTNSQSGTNSTTIGTNTEVTGSNNTTLGHNNAVKGSNNIIIANRAEVHIDGSQNILLDPVEGDLPFSTRAPSYSVVMGTGNNYNLMEDGGVGKVVIGRNNHLDGTHNVIIGNSNKNNYEPDEISDGYGSIVIGNENTQFGLYNSLLGYGNQVIKSTSSSHTRAHALGTNNAVSGFECNVLGNENKFNSTGNYQYVNINGHHNNIMDDFMDVTVNGNNNNLNQSGGHSVAILGHGNVLGGEFRQTVVGSGNNVSQSAIESIVIGYNINAQHSNVTYIGNGTSIEFMESTRDYRFFDANNKFQYSYLTGEITYKSLPSLANRDWYTGVEVLALKRNTVIANVADGADDNHAVTVKQLKTAIDIDNNDFALYGKANQYAVFNISRMELNYEVTWHVTSISNGSLVREDLITLGDKQNWITQNFRVIEIIKDSDGLNDIAWLLEHTGSSDIEILYIARAFDGSTDFDIIPVTQVLNGGYDALNNVSTIGQTTPLLARYDWQYNHSLHPTKADVFYVLAGKSNTEV